MKNLKKINRVVETTLNKKITEASCDFMYGVLLRNVDDRGINLTQQDSELVTSSSN
jgi:hypothetical protein